jgi:beta-galactosidase
MKRLVSIGMNFMILIWATTFAQAAQFGLASAWLFEETSGKIAKDAVGGNDGELKGSVDWSADGKFGRAVKFPGKGDSYIRIAHNDVFNSDPYTFTIWTKLKPTTWQYVIWRNGEVWPEAQLVRHIDIWIHKDHYPVFMWHVKGQVGRIDGKKIVADDKWHHIAKVYDGKSVKMYIDGELDGESPSGGQIDTSKSPIWLGARPGNVAATGLFDEVGFFTEALSETDIKDVMNKGLQVFALVDPAGKLATTWGDIRRK